MRRLSSSLLALTLILGGYSAACAEDQADCINGTTTPGCLKVGDALVVAAALAAVGGAIYIATQQNNGYSVPEQNIQRRRSSPSS